jgi:hypothetical protein
MEKSNGLILLSFRGHCKEFLIKLSLGTTLLEMPSPVAKELRRGFDVDPDLGQVEA